MRNIILVGFMGSGKSSIGAIISQKLRIPFIDTDKLIEQRLNISVKEIFEIYGEKYFRFLENRIVDILIKKKFHLI